jgi:hypothetical protein
MGVMNITGLNGSVYIFLMGFIEKYGVGTMIFGAAYKALILHNGTIDTYAHVPGSDTKKKIKRPLLLGEKLICFSMGVAISPMLAPFWVCRQLDRFDIAWRDKTPQEMGYDGNRTTVLDYLFS